MVGLRVSGRLGYGASGRLGYGNASNVGDAPNDTPGMIGPVNLGSGRTAVAISAGEMHTCARLADGSVRCCGTGRTVSWPIAVRATSAILRTAPRTRRGR